mmetsp:Transcript_30634/g.84496  ORF Transcript_30634/g.84496 Transcript_30634/m.84496 type:complete len:253 (-) Transcript_30634:651-1409(-)
MVTMVSQMALGKDSMLSRGSTKKISAEKTSVSSKRENKRMGNASKACSTAAITKRKRSKRLSILRSRRMGTMQRRYSAAAPRQPSLPLSGSTKPTAARSARGRTASTSAALWKSERNPRRLGQVTKRRSSSMAKTVSNVTSTTAAPKPCRNGGSPVCNNVVVTDMSVMAGMMTAYQPAPLLYSGLDRKFQMCTMCSGRESARSSSTWQLPSERLSLSLLFLLMSTSTKSPLVESPSDRLALLDIPSAAFVNL